MLSAYEPRTPAPWQHVIRRRRRSVIIYSSPASPRPCGTACHHSPPAFTVAAMMIDAAAVETADVQVAIPAGTTKLLANGKEHTIHQRTVLSVLPRRVAWVAVTKESRALIFP